MSLIEHFLPEFEHEMRGTRSMIELVPDSLLDWKANDSLNSVGWVASHLADTLSWVEAIVNEPSFDIAPIGGEPHRSPVLDTAAEILSSFDANLATAIPLMSAATDEQLHQPWSLLQGGDEVFTMPRLAVMKTFLINHMVHHRAFLVAYLRINDIECPGLYG